MQNLPVAQILNIPKQIFKALTSVRFGNSNEPTQPSSVPSTFDPPKSWYSKFFETPDSPLIPRASIVPKSFPPCPIISPQVISVLVTDDFSKATIKARPRCKQCPRCTSIQLRKLSSTACRKPPVTYKTGGKLRRYSNLKDRLLNRFSFFCKKYIDYMHPDPSPMKMRIVIDPSIPGKTKLDLYPVEMKKQARVTSMKSVPAIVSQGKPTRQLTQQEAWPLQFHRSFVSTCPKIDFVRVELGHTQKEAAISHEKSDTVPASTRLIHHPSSNFGFPNKAASLPKLHQNWTFPFGGGYSLTHSRKFKSTHLKACLPTFKTGMKYRRFSSFKEIIGERFAFLRTKHVPPIPLDISMMKMQIVTDKGAYGKTQLQLYPVPMERRQPRVTPMDGPPAREGSFKVEKPRIPSGEGPFITIIDLCNNAKTKMITRTPDARAKSAERTTFREQNYSKKPAKVDPSNSHDNATKTTKNSSPSMHWNISLAVLNERNEPKVISVEKKQTSSDSIVENKQSSMDSVSNKPSPAYNPNLKLITESRPTRITKNTTPTVEVVLRLDLQLPPGSRANQKTNAGLVTTSSTQEEDVLPAVDLDDHLKSYKKHGCCQIVAGRRPCPICYNNSTTKNDGWQKSPSLITTQPSNQTESGPFGVEMGRKSESNKLLSQTYAHDSKIIITSTDGRYLHSFSPLEPPCTRTPYKVSHTDIKRRLGRQFHTNAQHLPVDISATATLDSILFSNIQTQLDSNNSRANSTAPKGEVCSRCQANLLEDGTETLRLMCKLCDQSTENGSNLYEIYRKNQTSVDNEEGQCPICNLNHRPHCKNIQFTSY